MIAALRKRLAREEKGFTLIELLVVIIILGILTAIAIPSYLSFKDRANDSAAKANVRSILPTIESYYADHGTYVGMSLAELQSDYDQALDVSKYTMTQQSASSYCISATSGNKTWKKAGPAAQLLAGTVCS